MDGEIGIEEVGEADALGLRGEEEVLRVSGEGTTRGGAGGIDACLVVPKEQQLVEAARFVLIGQADRGGPAHLGLDDGDHAGVDAAEADSGAEVFEVQRERARGEAGSGS